MLGAPLVVVAQQLEQVHAAQQRQQAAQVQEVKHRVKVALDEVGHAHLCCLLDGMDTILLGRLVWLVRKVSEEEENKTELRGWRQEGCAQTPSQSRAR
jgi:hypothetical protein